MAPVGIEPTPSDSKSDVLAIIQEGAIVAEKSGYDIMPQGFVPLKGPNKSRTYDEFVTYTTAKFT